MWKLSKHCYARLLMSTNVDTEAQTIKDNTPSEIGCETWQSLVHRLDPVSSQATDEGGPEAFSKGYVGNTAFLDEAWEQMERRQGEKEPSAILYRRRGSVMAADQHAVEGAGALDLEEYCKQPGARHSNSALTGDAARHVVKAYRAYVWPFLHRSLGGTAPGHRAGRAPRGGVHLTPLPPL